MTKKEIEHFVDVWESSESLADVSTTLGMMKLYASAIACRLRRQGVKLKRFPKNVPTEIDVKAINQRIRKMKGR